MSEMEAAALLDVGCVIYVPSHDDGLDDDEDDLALYGDTGIPSHDDNGDITLRRC